jgi:hypothetical protein
MTFEEAEQLKVGDAVTRNGETGTVKNFYLNFREPNDLRVIVEWETGRQGTVPRSQLERA